MGLSCWKVITRSKQTRALFPVSGFPPEKDSQRERKTLYVYYNIIQIYIYTVYISDIAVNQIHSKALCYLKMGTEKDSVDN